MLRCIGEDIAESGPGAYDEEALLRLLAAIDALHVGLRSEVGRYLLDGLAELRQTESGTTAWKFRTVLGGHGAPQLGFGVCSQLTPETRAAFESWLLLRHHERGETEPLVNATSVGVLLTPRHDSLRDWDTTVIAITGEPALEPEELETYRMLWNAA